MKNSYIQYSSDRKILSRYATDSTKESTAKISDDEINSWIANWETGNRSIRSKFKTTTPHAIHATSKWGICSECYIPWKAKAIGSIYSDEIGAEITTIGNDSEIAILDQSQFPYPALFPDLTDSSSRSMLYSSTMKTGVDRGEIIQCTWGREAHEADCFSDYEVDLDMCRAIYAPQGVRVYAPCKQKSFENYQSCRGY